MKSFERDEMLREEGREEGREKGREEGREEERIKSLEREQVLLERLKKMEEELEMFRRQ